MGLWLGCSFSDSSQLVVPLGTLGVLWLAKHGFQLLGEFKRLAFHFKNSYKTWNCHRCHKLLWPLEAVYNSTSEEVGFCMACGVQASGVQCEMLNVTVDTAPFAAARCAAQALRTAFQVYWERPCLGSCGSRGCTWHSYSQVGQASESLASGLCQLLRDPAISSGVAQNVLKAKTNEFDYAKVLWVAPN